MTFQIPCLRSERLLLRAFMAADHAAYARMEANPAVREFRGGNLLSDSQAWTSMQLLLGQWPLRGYGVFALETSGAFVGFAGLLHPADWPEPEIAYSLDYPHWGSGFATEAARTVRDWAFRQFAFPLLASFILPGNHRSKRVAARLGAVREGTIEIRDMTVERWVYAAPGHGIVA